MKRTGTHLPRRMGRVLTAFATLVSFNALPVAAQAPGLDPDSIGAEFQAALQGLAWRAATARMHPEGLDYFKHRVTIFVEADTTGATLEALFEGSTRAAYEALDPTEVFVRVMEVFQAELPGLLNAWSARDVEVLGSIREGPDTRHVLYRNTPHLSGSDSELRTMTLKSHQEEWRVVTAHELETVPESLRGLLRFLISGSR